MFETWLIPIAASLASLGIYFSLPSRWSAAQKLRRFLGLLSLMPLFLFFPMEKQLGSFGVTLHFYLLATLTCGSGFMAITSRKPIYSALWFGLVLLGTASLFLLIGAQFLAAATIIVYAGAILVTLLFVVMLAQQAGASHYDHFSHEPSLASLSFFFTTWSLFTALKNTPFAPANDDPATHLSSDSHVAQLGIDLFTDHLIAVELAGTILLVALVAAVCIAMPPSNDKPADSERQTPLNQT